MATAATASGAHRGAKGQFSQGKWPKRRSTPASDEAGLAAALTVLRFPGVSQPTPQAPGQPVALEPSYHAIAASVGVAVCSLETLGEGIAQTAAAFRRRDVHRANLQLVQVADNLRLLSTLADAAASGCGLDLAKLGSSGRLDAMGAALDQLTSMQFGQDWAGVADALETAVGPALSGWRELFTEILVHADGRFRQPRAS